MILQNYLLSSGMAIANSTISIVGLFEIMT